MAKSVSKKPVEEKHEYDTEIAFSEMSTTIRSDTALRNKKKYENRNFIHRLVLSAFFDEYAKIIMEISHSNVLDFGCGEGYSITELKSHGVEFNSYNSNYTQDIDLSLATTTGGISMNIQQYFDMTGNVTGTASAVTGGISITYIDTVSNIGAKFEASIVTGEISYPSGAGFIGGTGTTQNYYTATSLYTISCSTTTGNIVIDGTSTI